MGDGRNVEVRNLWQHRYKKVYGIEHQWTGKEAKLAQTVLKFADRNFEDEQLQRIIEGMDRYFEAASRSKHDFMWFASSPHKWIYPKVKPKDYTPRKVEEPEPMTEDERIDYVRDWYRTNPTAFMSGFAMTYRAIKDKSPVMYKMITDIAKQELGEEKAADMWQRCKKKFANKYM